MKARTVVELDGTGKRFGIICARWNFEIGERLLTGAQQSLLNAGVAENDIEVMFVPGAYEIPLAAQRLAKTGRFDGLVALGCVIRGETFHFDQVAQSASQGVAEVMLRHDIPIGFGVLCVDTLAHANARACLDGGENKGIEAADAALEMANPAC